MAKHIKSPTLSIAKMQSPGSWIEPGQIPKFDEYTVVLRGLLKVDTKNESFEVRKGEAIIISSGEWVRYSSPKQNGAEYIAVYLPAFSPDTVNRDE